MTESNIAKQSKSDTRLSSLGLDNPNLKSCEDRGSEYHRQDNPISQPPSSTPPDLSLDETSIVADIRSKLRSARKNYGKLEAWFIPRGSLDKIMQFNVVEFIIRSLSCCKGFSDEKKNQFIGEVWYGKGEICQNPCVKLLATLVGIGDENYFLDFIKDGINDSCLPLGYHEGKFLECRNCCKKHQILDKCDENRWDDFGSWAYAVNAPYLKVLPGQHVHYELDQNDRLPYLKRDKRETPPAAPPIQQSNNRIINSTSSYHGGAGGFSELFCVEFEPSQINFGLSKVSEII
jgi:hypothetical protein